VFVDVLTSDEAWGKKGAVDEFVSSLCPLSDAVHETGAKIGIQLAHANRFPQGLSPVDIRGEAVAPSPRVEEDLPAPLVVPGTEMRALTIPEIKTIIHNFGVAALNAMKAGFDFVEFHSCHGLLPCQFFSPLENRRNDKYGGDMLRRMRFGIECIAAMRQAVGDDYSIFARVGAIDDRPGGITIGEGAEYAHQLERAGVDAISISVASRSGYIPTADYPPGCFADLAERVKERVTVPVIVAGRITTPEVAESILARGQADLIAMGRQLIADPLWVKKVKEGQPNEITPCSSCNSCCESFSTGKLCCPVNPGAGQETDSPP
jgi:2,4-dienoyl-CoA reductase (NADPH2)